MKCTIYIPYATGDAVKGFRYEGEELTPKKYVNMENKEYYDHKDGVDYMVSTSLGNNIAINNYQKRKINVNKQEFQYYRCDCNVRDISGSDIKPENLEEYWRNNSQFGLIVYLNNKEVDNNPDMETDLKMWIQDSQKIFNITELSEEEKVFHLPKKDFKIDFDNGNSHAVLKNCKFGKLMSTSLDKRGRVPVTSFAMIIERIIFTKR